MIGDVLLECELEPGDRANAGRIREPRRAHIPGRGRRAARAGRGRLRQQRRGRLRGLPRRPSARDVPPRPARCRATPGSPTGCSRTALAAPPGRAVRRSRRSPTGSRSVRSRSPPAGRAHAAAGSTSSPGSRLASRRPQGAEVDDRIAGLPTAQEALDRRMHRDLESSSTSNSRWPRTAASYEVTARASGRRDGRRRRCGRRDAASRRRPG